MALQRHEILDFFCSSSPKNVRSCSLNSRVGVTKNGHLLEVAITGNKHRNVVGQMVPFMALFMKNFITCVFPMFFVIIA